MTADAASHGLSAGIRPAFTTLSPLNAVADGGAAT